VRSPGRWPGGAAERLAQPRDRRVQPLRGTRRVPLAPMARRSDDRCRPHRWRASTGNASSLSCRSPTDSRRSPQQRSIGPRIPKLTIRNAAVAKDQATSDTDPPLARSITAAATAPVSALLPYVGAPLPPDGSLAPMNHHIHIMLARTRIADCHAAAAARRDTRRRPEDPKFHRRSADTLLRPAAAYRPCYRLQAGCKRPLRCALPR
jgi:hypothetical protein